MFDSLSDIKPGREAWRIRVRAVRLWKVPAFLSPGQTNSIEMVLVDDKVCFPFSFLSSLVVVNSLCLFTVFLLP